MIVISDGVAVGKAIIKHTNFDVKKVIVQNKEKEIDKFNKAKEKCLSDLERIRKFANKDNVCFIDAHILMIKDPSLYKDTINIIENESVNAEYAFTTVIDKYINLIQNSKDEYLQERYLDIKDIKNKMLQAMNNETDISKIDYDYIVFTEEVFPSLILHANKHLKGIVAKTGGYTSHSAILANAIGIVYIIDDTNAFEGDTVILDGRNSLIRVNPNNEDVEIYKKKALEQKSINISELKKKFNICANISSNMEIENLKLLDLEGIGLYRSEFIFIERNSMPSYEEQKSIYNEALKSLNPKSVTIRTVDLGDDKQIEYVKTDKKGVENYIKYNDIFETQIKALVDANEFNNLKIMFPMIKTVDEFKYLKEKVLKYTNKNIEIGMMVETKEALYNIEQFDEPDFFSLGTNDLLQELYGVRRDTAFDYTKYLDDLKIKLKPLVDYCKKVNKKLSVCGELASKTDGIRMLVEIGITNFSVGINNVFTLFNTLKQYV